VAELDPKLLEQQMDLVAEKIATFPRHARGYQGRVRVEDVIVVVSYRGDDGHLWFADPSEINDGHPDLFLREYVVVGNRRRGTSVSELIERFLPLISPKAAATFGWLRTLLPVLLALALLAGPAVADTLALDHAKLLARARKGIGSAAISYTSDRVVLRARVRWGLFWIPLRLEATFQRVDGHVRLVTRDLYIRGRLMPSRKLEADEKLAKLVDVESKADRVTIEDEEYILYEQALPK
jgi:hypothetical protein